MAVKRPYSIDLSAQMAVCDANFIRILQLLPDLSLGARREIGLVGMTASGLQRSGAIITTLEVTECFKYTSTIRITQSLDQTLEHYLAPEIIVRMYHDAKTAEVVSYQQVRYLKAKYPLPNKDMYQADEKEQINFFLSEWLSFCQREGLCLQTALMGNMPAMSAA